VERKKDRNEAGELACRYGQHCHHSVAYSTQKRVNHADQSTIVATENKHNDQRSHLHFTSYIHDPTLAFSVCVLFALHRLPLGGHFSCIHIGMVI
jgi:hypothetical protein